MMEIIILDDANENQQVSQKYEEVWDKIKKEIETINGGKKIEYEKDYKKIRFQSNDDLSLNKTIKILLLAITIRCVISKDGKFYPHFFSDDALYELV